MYLNSVEVFFVHGGVGAEDREEVREITENENDAIIVASYGTFSTGINIRNLHNVSFSLLPPSRVYEISSPLEECSVKGTNKDKSNSI